MSIQLAAFYVSAAILVFGALGISDVAGKYYVPQIGSFIIYFLMVALMIAFPALLLAIVLAAIFAP